MIEMSDGRKKEFDMNIVETRLRRYILYSSKVQGKLTGMSNVVRTRVYLQHLLYLDAQIYVNRLE